MGYEETAIKAMKPTEAWEILNENVEKEEERHQGKIEEDLRRESKIDNEREVEKEGLGGAVQIRAEEVNEGGEGSMAPVLVEEETEKEEMKSSVSSVVVVEQKKNENEPM